MNLDRVERLATVLETLNPEAPDVGFNMATFGPSEVREDLEDLSGRGCNTTCCIAGHAAILAQSESRSGRFGHPTVVAREWLGLSERESEALFIPTGRNTYDATSTQAAAVLRNLAKTVRVDWAAVVGSEEDGGEV